VRLSCVCTIVLDLEEIAQSRSVTIPLTDASLVDTATSRV
jgi:hypothetical protein